MGLAPHTSTVTVTTAGTRVRGTATSTYVISVYIEALKTNSGVIYAGESTVSATSYMCALTAGSGFGISTDGHGRSSGPEFQLSSLWYDSSVSGDKVQVTYFYRTDNY
jgi:hypothetical protein